jgi:glycosyltransferase involved in cell wall biosynthesis
MRIAIFTESYEPIVNGVSVCVSTLRDGLIKRGHEVFIFAPAYKGYTDKVDGVTRTPAAHTFFMPDYPFPLPLAPAAKRVFSELKPDLVHTQSPFMLSVLGARWARQYNVPLVATNHTLYTEYAHYAPIRPKSLTKRFLIDLIRWYYSGPDAVVVPSGPVAKMLRSYGIKNRMEVIKTGVDPIPPLTPEDREAARELRGVGPGDFLLLYVGRIAREKNLRMLLTAFKTVLTAHPQSKLVLVGGGPALAETKEYADGLQLGDKVEFMGMLPRNDIEPVYGAADAFAFPSTTETQGIAICEALSAGLPVVAVDAGGIPENLENGCDGFLTADDPAEFADRISFLIKSSDDRRQMSVRARQNALNFSIDRMVDEFESLYQSVINAADQTATAGAS